MFIRIISSFYCVHFTFSVFTSDDFWFFLLVFPPKEQIMCKTKTYNLFVECVLIQFTRVFNVRFVIIYHHIVFRVQHLNALFSLLLLRSRFRSTCSRNRLWHAFKWFLQYYYFGQKLSNSPRILKIIVFKWTWWFTVPILYVIRTTTGNSFWVIFTQCNDRYLW